MPDFFKQLFCDFDESFSVVIEDDERVAYAYLYEAEDIIGDVWLYNTSPAPLETDWNDIEGMPFLNPQDFIKEILMPIENEGDIDLKWIASENEEIEFHVEIYIRGRLIAKMEPGSLPGWSKLVTKDGPLAQVYE